MKLEIILIFNFFAVFMFIYLRGMARRIDQYARYNNTQADFKAPANWMKFMFWFRSELIPKYIYYRCFGIVAVLSGPIGSLVYCLLDGNKTFAGIFIIIQAGCCVLDLIMFYVFLSFYNGARKGRG